MTPGSRFENDAIIETLVQQASDGLAKDTQYVIPPQELRRVWPDLSEREQQEAVLQFAKEHGWRLYHFSRVLGAVLVRD